MKAESAHVAAGALLKGGNLRTFQSLRSPTFRVYWGSNLAQTAAMNMQMVARALLMYEITGSAILLGVSALASAVPMLLLSLWGGVLADRVQKRTVLIIGQIASAVVSLAIGVLVATGVLVWQYLLATGFAQGVVVSLMMPARQSIVPELVGRDGIMNALALNMAGQNLNRIMSPALAGVMIQFAGFDTLYFAMTGLYVVGALVAGFLPPTSRISRASTTMLKDALQGLEYARGNSTVLLILGVTLAAVVFSFPYLFLLPLLTTEVWGVEAGAYGLLVTFSGIGAIVASLVLASLADRDRGRLFLAGLLVSGLALATLSFSPWFMLAIFVMIFVGLGQTMIMAMSNTLVQYYTDESYRGRMMSIWMMEFGLMSIGAFLIALVSEATGPQLALGGAALILVMIGLLATLLSPRLRRLE